MNDSSTNISGFYGEITRRLADVRAKETRVSLLHGLLIAFIGIVGLTILSVVLEGVFNFGTMGRTILFAIVSVGAIGLLAVLCGKAVLRMIGVLKGETHHTLASHVGEHFPQIRDRLLDALQMYEGKDAAAGRYSPELIDASFIDLYEAIQPLTFTDSVDNIRVRRMGRMALYSSALIILMLVVSPMRLSLLHILNYNTVYAAPAPIVFHVEPGNAEVVRGQGIPIIVRTEGKPLQQITLHTRPAGQAEFDAQPVARNNEGLFRTELSNMKATTEYYASAEETKSESFIVTVLDRPLIRSLQVTVVPPGYTRLPAQKLEENAGDVTAYPGSRVEIDVASSKNIAGGQAVFSNGKSIPLTCTGEHGEGAFSVHENGTYHLELKDRDGLTSVDPVEYTIRLLADEYPTVEVQIPGRNVDMTDRMQMELGARIKDDFGFSSVRLAYRLAASKYAPPAKDMTYVDLPFNAKLPSQDIGHHWDLGPMSLVPEDAVEYYVEVHDNDNVTGPKSARSQTYLIRLPSLEEVFSDVDQQHQESMQSIQEAAKQSEELKKNVEEIQRDLQKNRDKADWHQQQKADEMVKKYEAMKQKLEQASKSMEEMTKKMDENRLLSPETMQKYSEMQKLMQELNSAELQAALKKLQQMSKQPNMTPEQMRQAMDQLKASEDSFRKGLERTIELLKRIHIEQKIDELVKRAEELRKQQEDLRAQASKTDPNDQKKRDELAEHQSDLQKQEEQLEKEAADLKDKMEEFSKEMPMEEMSKAQENLSKEQVGQKMQQSSQQMKSGQMQQAQQGQKQSEKALQDFQEQMQQAQKSLQDKQMKQVVNQMRKQLKNLIELSKRQEELKSDAQSMDPNSQRFRDGAQKQDEMMNDLGNVAQSMTELAKKSFVVSPEMGKEVGDALKEMGEALNQMEGRNPGGATDQQGAAMGSLNRAAMMMQNALSGLMSGGQQGGGMGMAGLMGRLGQMMGQQSGINSGTQGAMGMGGEGGQGMSAQQQAEYQRLSNQQGAVRQNLEDLAKEAKNSGDYSKLLGDLDKVAQEMKEVQTDLSQGNVNPETIRKQEHILSRLLDSQRSTRERDYEKRRKAEAGKAPAHASPGDIDLTTQEGKDKMREELLRSLEGKYTKDYEDLIRKYFEALEKGGN